MYQKRLNHNETDLNHLDSSNIYNEDSQVRLSANDEQFDLKKLESMLKPKGDVASRTP
jgi:hypothetical protein